MQLLRSGLGIEAGGKFGLSSGLSIWLPAGCPSKKAEWIALFFGVEIGPKYSLCPFSAGARLGPARAAWLSISGFSAVLGRLVRNVFAGAGRNLASPHALARSAMTPASMPLVSRALRASLALISDNVPTIHDRPPLSISALARIYFMAMVLILPHDRRPSAPYHRKTGPHQASPCTSALLATLIYLLRDVPVKTSHSGSFPRGRGTWVYVTRRNWAVPCLHSSA